MPIEERQDEYNVLMYLFHNPGSVSICPDLNSDSLASDIKVFVIIYLIKIVFVI